VVIICTTCCEINVLWNWPHGAFYMILPVENDYFPVVFMRNSCSLWGRKDIRGHNLILSMALKGLLLSVMITSCYLNCKRFLHGVCNLFFLGCGAATQRGSSPPHSWGFLDHKQRRTTVGRTPLEEWSARRRDLYRTTHNTHNRQTSMPPVGFEAAADLRLRPRGHWDRQSGTLCSINLIYLWYQTPRLAVAWFLSC